MYRFLTKNGTSLAFGIGLLAAIIFLVPVFGGMESYNALTDETRNTSNIFNAGLWVVIILIILCLFISIAFGVWQLISNPKGSMKSIIGLVVIGILFFILFSMAQPETTGRIAEVSEEFEVTAGASKFISAGLWTLLALLAVAALSFVVSEVRNVFK